MIFQDHVAAAAAAANDLQKDYLKNITTLEEIVNAACANTIKAKKQTAEKGCRVMSLCLHDGQRIRHKRSLPTAWIATYKKATNTILYKDTHYFSLGQFAQAHYNAEKPSRTTVSGWLECECATELEKWISTSNLPLLKN